jgi:glycosyltransferase involved in cell wall biosynthesis
MIKILHVMPTIDPRYGGPVEGVMRSAEIWARHGHVRHIVSFDAPTEEWISTSSVKVFPLGIRRHWYRKLQNSIPLMRYGYTPKLNAWLRRHAEDYDAIVINGLWHYASLGTWFALRKSSVPYFVFPHGMLDPWSVNKFPIKGIMKKLFWYLFERRVLRDAKNTLYTCKSEMDLAKIKYYPYSARDYVIGYGTSDVPAQTESQLEAFFSLAPAARGRKLILFLSRIHEKKGIDLLLKAFSNICEEFSEFDLVIAGPDQSELKPTLVELAKQLQIVSRVHWPGMLLNDAKWGAFRCADFFVLPSHQENFGIAIVEAMAAQLPVLISDRVNICREIEEADAGIIVSVTVEAVEEGLRRMCALNSQMRIEKGARARALFLERFNLEQIALNQLTLFQGATHKKQDKSGSEGPSPGL